MKVKKYKEPNIETWLKGKLRQASLRWPPRNEALKRARIDRGNYRCAMCDGTYKSYQVHLDHIEPVIPLTEGFTTWDKFIARLFCNVDSFQVVCTECHDAKTTLEENMRLYYRNQKREEKALKQKEEQSLKRKK